jgi:hypothetical protein
MDTAGNTGFAIMLIVFFVGTVALALSLEGMIDQWSRLRERSAGRGFQMPNGQALIGSNPLPPKPAGLGWDLNGVRRRARRNEASGHSPNV